MSKAYKAYLKYLYNINEKNKFGKEIGKFVLTNHAIQRYKERISNVPNKKAKKDILLHLKKSNWLGEYQDRQFRFYHSFVYVFKRISNKSNEPNWSLLTITTFDEEEGNTYFSILMEKRHRTLNRLIKMMKEENNF